MKIAGNYSQIENAPEHLAFQQNWTNFMKWSPSFCLFRCARDLSFLLFVSSPTICLVQCTECDVLVSEISVILFLKGSWYVKIWNQSIGKGLDKFGTEKVSEPGKKKLQKKSLNSSRQMFGILKVFELAAKKSWNRYQKSLWTGFLGAVTHWSRTHPMGIYCKNWISYKTPCYGVSLGYPIDSLYCDVSLVCYGNMMLTGVMVLAWVLVQPDLCI